MIEIHKYLYIGSDEDFKKILPTLEKWAVVHACKEPYHRELLGYTGRSAPKSHPEYFLAERGNILYLNLIDAPDPKYISDEIIDAALLFIDRKLKDNMNVLVHCNKGESRAPSIGLLYMATRGHLTGTVDEMLWKFVQRYPNYFPGTGMQQYTNNRLQKLMK